jgi:hypothetical protein
VFLGFSGMKLGICGNWTGILGLLCLNPGFFTVNGNGNGHYKVNGYPREAYAHSKAYRF